SLHLIVPVPSSTSIHLLLYTFHNKSTHSHNSICNKSNGRKQYHNTPLLLTIASLPGIAGPPTTAQSTNMSSTPRTSRKHSVSALQPLLSNDAENDGTKRKRTEHGGKAVKGKAVKEKAVRVKEEDTKFWKKPGMDTFLDWLLNADNQQRFKTTGTTAGTLVKDLRDEIATFINNNSEDRGKDGGRDLKMKKTGGGDDEADGLEEQVRKICPMFARFHDVYLHSTRVYPFFMVQTTTIPGEPEPVFDNSDENSNSDRSDSDEGDEGDASHEHVQASDDDVETRTTNSITAAARLSQQQRKQDRKK
ncbi:hypothetical protein BGZ95_007513, partial [Linnemannia exigua]